VPDEAFNINVLDPAVVALGHVAAEAPAYRRGKIAAAHVAAALDVSLRVDNLAEAAVWPLQGP